MKITDTEWLARIVAEDDPANGGFGLLAPCPGCKGSGAVPATGADQYAGIDDDGYAPCGECGGSGNYCDTPAFRQGVAS